MEKTAQPKSSVLSISESDSHKRIQNIAGAHALHVSSLFTASDPNLE